ncbi:MAG: glycosyltransferase family 9 protein [Fusobacteriaceae bacterium]
MRILVIRLSSIGDIILTTPVLKAFKEKYPEVKIDFLVRDQFRKAIEDCPYIDKVIIFNKNKNDGFKNIKIYAEKIKNDGNYDYIFDLHCKIRSKLILFFIGSKTFSYKKRSWWKSLLVKMRFIKYQVDDTIVKNYFKAFKEFEIEYKTEDIEFSFSEKDLKNIKKEWRDLVVFAPGASKNTKKWCFEEFSKLAKLLFDKYGKKIAIIGGEEDSKIANKINELSGNNCINLCGIINLKESGALLSKSKFLVTNDSGPFHMARGVKCKTFVIFGPTNPKMFELEKNDTLVYLNEKCSPCSLHGDKVCPKKHFNCMRKITAMKLFEIIELSSKQEEN